MSPLLVLALSTTTHAATLLVDPATTGAHPTIMSAVRAANAGDEIEVKPGVYRECLGLQGVDIRIVGPAGAADTVLDCQSAAPAAIEVEFGEGLTLEGLTIRNAGRIGVRLSPGASLWGADLDLSELGGGEGGAIVGRDASIDVEQSTLSDNIADEGAAIHADGGWVSLRDSTVEGNFAVLAGGAIALRGGAGLMLSGGSLSHNESASDGGAIALSGGAAITLDRAVLHGNVARGEGGAILLEDGGLVAFGGQLTGNRAGHGGGVAALGEATLDLDGTALSGNLADGHGGDLLAERGRVSLRSVTSSGSSAQTGATLYARPDRAMGWGASAGTGGGVTLVDTMVTGAAGSASAALAVENHPLVIEGGEFSHNLSFDASAITTTGGTVRISGVDFQGNSGNAVVVWDAPTAALTASTFRGNLAGLAGTGAAFYQVEELQLEELDFIDNETWASPALVVANSRDASLRRLRFLDQTDGDSHHLWVYGSHNPTTVDAEAILVQGSQGELSRAVVLTGEWLRASLRNVSVISPGGISWGIEAREGAQVTLVDSHVKGAWHPLVERDGAAVAASHCAWSERVTPGDIPGEGHVYDHPAIRSGIGGDGLPTWTPAPHSPLIDAGDPSGPGDADGTRADIGWMGGQAAGAWDIDGDGHPRATDCDDGLATTHPGAADVAGDGVDSDCDGVDGTSGAPGEEDELPDEGAPDEAVDPDDGGDSGLGGALAGLGCSTRPGGPAGVAGLLALGLLALRRRSEG